MNVATWDSTMSADSLTARIRVRLTAIQYAARDINLFHFRPLGKIALPAAAAGAHIDIHLPNGDVRQYSLVLGADTTTYVVAVKRDANGRGGSIYMHDNLFVGTELDISAPRNNFPLREDSKHSVLIAGGIGITPIWSMVRRLQETGASWQMHFASRSPEDAAFLEELQDLKQVRFHFDSENNGRPLNIDALLQSVSADADIYCCGPTPMLEAFERAVEGRPAERLHVEYFVPKMEAAEGGFNVRLARTGIDVTVPVGSSILDALLDAGVNVPYSCTEGICGACQVGVLEGIPDHRDTVLTEAEHAANNCIMVCCSGCKTGGLTLDL